MLLLSIFGGASDLASRLLAGGGEGEPSLLSVNPGLMIWTVVTFVLMMIVLRVVAWKPLLGVLDLRQQTIQGSLDQAKQAQEEADKALAENRELLAQARQESDKILAESRDQAERGRTETLEQAREEARRLREQAGQEIEAQKRAAIAEIRSQVSELAIAAAGRLLAEDLDGDRQRKLVEGYLSELEGQGGGSAGLPS